MASHWQRLAVSSSLLLLLLVGVAALLALTAGSVLLPQAGMFVWIALGFVAFVGAQLVMFRLLGLRSRVDEQPDDTDAEAAVDPDPEHATDTDADAVERDADWRAWRG